MYKIPYMGKRSDMEQVFATIKEHVVLSVDIEEKQSFINLCASYIVIIVGVFWGTYFELLFQKNLWDSVWHLGIGLIVMVILHWMDKSYLREDDFSVGVLLRCMGCSLIIAQYILWACRMEEMIKQNSMELSVSVQGFIGVSVMYCVSILAFMPSKSIGKRCMKYVQRKRKI